MGGHLMSPSQGTPWWTRSAAREIDKPSMGGGIGKMHMQDGGDAQGAPDLPSPHWALGAETGLPPNVAEYMRNTPSLKEGSMTVPRYDAYNKILRDEGSPTGDRSDELFDAITRARTFPKNNYDHLADGGMSMSTDSPWWERSEAQQSQKINDVPFHGGLIGGSGGGRTDQIPMSVPGGSHVMTADTISGMGQGNTASGARNLMAALRIGPWGVPVPKEVHGHGPPKPPHVPGDVLNAAHGGHPRRTSVLVASGEFVVPEDDWIAKDDVDGLEYLHRGVRSIGDGDSKKGHDRLDDLMKRVREFNVKWLKKAPPPKK